MMASCERAKGSWRWSRRAESRLLCAAILQGVFVDLVCGELPVYADLFAVFV